jgi:hypothetical protein
MPIDEPAVALPPLISSTSSLNDFVQEGTDYRQENDRSTHEPDPDDESSDDDLYNKEAPSMTLRDILLRADTTQFDLLGMSPFPPKYVPSDIWFTQGMIQSNWLTNLSVGIM